MIIKRDRDIVGMDISGDEFVLARLKNAGMKSEIADIVTYSIKGKSEDDIAAVAQKAAADLRVKNPGVLLVISAALTITKNLEIPSLDAREIREIIDLQSGRQTPYSREEIIVDYIRIGTYRQNYTKILLVIATRAAVKKQLSVLEKAGLRCERILFAPEGISALCSRRFKGDTAQLPLGIIHIDANTTDFIVALKGRPVWTRSIPVGAAHFSGETEKITEKFCEELKKSLETYQSEDIERSPQYLLITGACAAVKNMQPVLTGQLQIPGGVISCADFLPPDSAPAIAANVSLLNVTAALLEAKNLQVDLLPEEVKLRRAFEERARELLKMGVWAIVILVLAGGIFLNRLYFKNEYLKLLRAELQRNAPETEVLEKAMEKIRIVKHHLQQRGHALRVLAALYEVLPKRILLTDIKLDPESRLHLKGTARAMSDVFAFAAELENSEHFRGVQTNYTTSRKENNEDWADFGISCVVNEVMQ